MCDAIASQSACRPGSERPSSFHSNSSLAASESGLPFERGKERYAVGEGHGTRTSDVVAPQLERSHEPRSLLSAELKQSMTASVANEAVAELEQGGVLLRFESVLQGGGGGGGHLNLKISIMFQ